MRSHRGDNTQPLAEGLSVCIQEAYKKMRKQYLRVLMMIERQASSLNIPYVTKVAQQRKPDPFRVLVSCILSLRTKDKVTEFASRNLFKLARTPEGLAKLNISKIEELIYPVGFYRNKAKALRNIARSLINNYQGCVPDKREELLSLGGVGPKTANLVLGLGFGVPAICVDTHVHRISNRLGWINTASPGDSEAALMRIIPRNKWIELNTVLVGFGQKICLPVSPLCSKCRVEKYCSKVGVRRWR